MGRILPLLLIAFATSVLLTPLLRAWARSTGRVARPTEDRWHREPVALFGGVAIFLAILVATAPVVSAQPHLRWWLVAVGLAFVLGIVDDVRSLPPQTKLAVQIMLAGILVVGGYRLDIVGYLPGDLFLTFLWIIGVANAFNLLDHMDGVSAGVAVVAGLTLAVLFGLSGSWPEAALGAALAGAALGFLCFNFSPGSIFMGDAGSMTLGVGLAGLAISPEATAARGVFGAIFVPILIFLVPILDTGLVILTRLRSGRSVAAGGVDHTSHRLVALGFSERAAAGLLWSFAAIGGAGAVLITLLSPGWPLLVVVLYLFALLLLAIHLGRLQVYERDPGASASPISVIASNLLHKKRTAEVVLDLTVVTMTFFGTLWILEVPIPDAPRDLELLLAGVVVTKTVIFSMFGFYRGHWRYFSVSDLPRYLVGITVTSALLLPLFAAFFPDSSLLWARIGILDLLLTANLLLITRVSERMIGTVTAPLKRNGRRSVVYGAGDRGELAVRLLKRGRPFRSEVVALVDDSPENERRQIHSVPVAGTGDQLRGLLRDGRITDLIVACDLEQKRLDEVAALAQTFEVTVYRFDVRFMPLDHDLTVLPIGPRDRRDLTPEPSPGAIHEEAVDPVRSARG